MLAHAVRVHGAGPGGRHRRHRRRPGEHRQHLHDGRGRDRRRRGAGGQARQPGGVEQVRRRRSAGGSRRRDLAAGRRRSPATVAEVGIGFCFAPVFHPSFRHAGAPRRELGIPTVFNFLGPLTNPAQPAAGAIGCGNAADGSGDGRGVRRGAGARDVLLFRGDDGLDELTTTTTSTVWEVRDGVVRHTDARPRTAGYRRGRNPAICAAATSATTWRSRATLFAGETGAGAGRRRAERRRRAGRTRRSDRRPAGRPPGRASTGQAPRWIPVPRRTCWSVG